MDNSSDVILALKPVTFHYKEDPKAIPQFGLVAEDVEAVNPDLVVRDNEGKVNTVRYDAINAMLLNEFLKEHKVFLEEQRKLKEQGCKMQEQDRKILEQETTIAQLKKEVETVVAHAKEQDSKIQKGSDQVEMSRPVPQMVLNNP
jgi:hypothetical protein